MFRDFQENPIVARFRANERRRQGSAMRRFVRRQAVPLSIFLGSLCLVAVIRAGVGGGSDWVAQVLAAAGFMTCLAVPLLAPFRSLGSTFAAFTGERESRTLDSLLGTRLSAKEIAQGKLWVGIWPLLRELALLAPLVLVLGCCAHYPVQSLVYLGLCAGFVGFFGILGLWCSATSKGTQAASRKGTLMACALIFGAPALACFVDQCNRSAATAVGFLFSPLFTATCFRLTPSDGCGLLMLNWLVLGVSGLWLWRSTLGALSEGLIRPKACEGRSGSKG